MRELRRACCGMLLGASAVLAFGCARYGPNAIPPQTTIDVHVESDCHLADANQDMVHLDYLPPSQGPYNTQVRWIVDKGPDDTAVITAKGASYQGNGNEERGKKIRTMHPGTFVLGPGHNEAFSGRPKHAPPFEGDKAVVWFYSIDIVHADRDPCHFDPGLCYRTADGSWICSR